jgi:hypothetical protein
MGTRYWGCSQGVAGLSRDKHAALNAWTRFERQWTYTPHRQGSACRVKGVGTMADAALRLCLQMRRAIDPGGVRSKQMRSWALAMRAKRVRGRFAEASRYHLERDK